MTRWTAGAGLFAAAIALSLGAAPAMADATTANAAAKTVVVSATTKPKPTPTKPAAVSNKPAVITLAGSGVTSTISVSLATDQRLFQALDAEVSWLSSSKATSAVPAASKLGPRYTVSVLTAAGKTLQTFDLYPMATGGPRVWRPANEPTGVRSGAWLYGRLSMPATLQAAGVPLQAKPDVVSGGIGGGIGTDIKVSDTNATADSVGGYFGEVERLFLLNGAVVVTVLFGLAGVAFLIRRKV